MPRAVVCRELGPPERLRLEIFASLPLTQGQVRVAVHAAGINFPDILMAAGEYQLKPDLPFTPGVEAAGEIAAIGPDVAAFKPGDRFANGLSVCSVVLLPLDVGLHVGRRHQERTVCPSALSSRDQ